MSDDDFQKKNRPEQMMSVNNASLPNHGVESDKNKYINFIITDYGHLATNIADCVNSSTHFYLGNDTGDG